MRSIGMGEHGEVRRWRLSRELEGQSQHKEADNDMEV